VCRSTSLCKASHQYSFRLGRPAVDVDHPVHKLPRPRHSYDGDTSAATSAVVADPHSFKHGIRPLSRSGSGCASIVCFSRATHCKMHQRPDGQKACRVSVVSSVQKMFHDVRTIDLRLQPCCTMLASPGRYSTTNSTTLWLCHYVFVTFNSAVGSMEDDQTVRDRRWCRSTERNEPSGS
jgi:hypothetical protein